MTHLDPLPFSAMDEAAARRYLLVRAVEESDPQGRLLPEAERQRAGRLAREQGPPAAEDPAGFLARRSRYLAERLEERHPRLGRLAPRQGTGAFVLWSAAILALLAGVGLNQLGPPGAINVLSVPLLGLFAWNLFVYAAGIAVAVRARARGAPPERRPLRPTLRGAWAERAGAWLSAVGSLPAPRPSGGELDLSAASARYLRDWLRAASPLHRARGELVFHLAAACLIAGAVAGMYLRGLVVEYRATWESTFLGAEQVHGLLRAVFAPAARILGQPFPPLEEIRSMRTGEVSAAPWIHYYAVTALYLVLAPRLVLALAAGRRARDLAAEVPLELERDPYAARLTAPDRGEGAAALVVACSHRLSEGARRTVTAALAQALGDRARVELGEPVAYGEEPGELAGLGGAGRSAAVCVLNLAQTPEPEVHGEQLAALRRRAEERGATLVVLLDETPWAERFGTAGGDAREPEDRREAWREVAQAAGVELFGFRAGAPDALAGELRAAFARSGRPPAAR